MGPRPPEDRDQELRRLREENGWLRAVLRYAGDILVTTDLAGRVTEWSGGAEKILGWTKDEILGKPVSMLYVDPGTRRELIRRLRDEPGEPVLDQEIQVRRKDGKKLWLSLSLADLLGPDGRRIGNVGVSKDITERKRLERDLRRLSRTDKLTGLYNQAHFFERLEIEKERAVRLGHALTLVLFDLDRFKDYNDAHGHEAGHRVLRFVGAVIFQSIRKEVDSGYRYGGDEFCCLLPGSGIEGGLAFAERIRAQVEAARLDTVVHGGGAPLPVAEQRGPAAGMNPAGTLPVAQQRGPAPATALRAEQFRTPPRAPTLVTTSIGLCAFDPQDRALQIVKAADEAMYRAKRTGGNRICIHGRPDEAWRAGAVLPEAGPLVPAAAQALAQIAVPVRGAAGSP